MPGRSVLQRAGIATFICLLAATIAAPAASAGGAQHVPLAGMALDLGSSPTGLPVSCPFPNSDANFVFLSGRGVEHESTNKNGDWGGFTGQGTATFYEDETPIAVGHLTVWGGGGNNKAGQTEGGTTVNFTGSAEGLSVAIHVNVHQTTNNAGKPTANVGNVHVSCAG
jgi:hypothetical protein